jgi:hypothetical protein
LNAARSGLSVPDVGARRIAVPLAERGSSTAITVKNPRRSVNVETGGRHVRPASRGQVSRALAAAEKLTVRKHM